MADDPFAKFRVDAPVEDPSDPYSRFRETGGMPGTDVPPEPKPWAERAADAAAYYEKLTRLGVNAATFGMADRFAAGGEALTGGAPSYAEALKREVGQTQKIREELQKMGL